MQIKEEKILLGHGSGGKLMNELIMDEIVSAFGKDSIQLDDSAILDVGKGKIAFTTDSYTITPIFFNGGNIGSLAINGTVNDLAVMGAEPKYISCGLIIEEGLLLKDLRIILMSMRSEADKAGVKIVTGDTKVVEGGKADKIFINTAGIGVFNNNVIREDIKIGDKIIVNGTIGDHGMTIMAQRNKLSFSSALSSDCAPLNHLIKNVIIKFPDSVRFIRDATRGGVASVLNEIVSDKDFSVKLIESDLPIRSETGSVCDILGIDPLYSANEGKLIMVVDKNDAEHIVEIMKQTDEGLDSAIIGEVTDDFKGKVFVETIIKGKRMVPLLLEDQLPRIC